MKVKGLPQMEEESPRTADIDGRRDGYKVAPTKRKMKWDEYIDWFEGLEESDRDNMIMYLYRSWPKLIKVKKPGQTQYIDKWMGDKDYSDIVATHGGGKYYAAINNLQTNKQMGQIWIEIDTNKYEPKFDIAELDIAAWENKSYVKKLQLEGRLDEDGNEIKEGQREMEVVEKAIDRLDRVHKDMNDEMKRMYEERLREKNPGEEVFSHGAKAAIDMVREQARDSAGGGIAALVPMFQTMVEVMKDNKGNGGDQFQMFQLIMEQQRLQTQLQLDAMKQQNEMILKMMEKRTDDGDVFKQIERFMTVRDLFDGGRDKGSVVERVADKLIDAAPGVLQNMGSFMQMMNMAKQGQGQMNTTPNPQMVNNNEGHNIPIKSGPTEGEKIMLAERFVSMQKGIIIEKLKEGKSGEDFAIDVCEMFGRVNAEQLQGLLKMVGEKNISNAIYKDEQLKGAVDVVLDGKEGLDEWVKSVVEFNVEKYYEEKNKENQ